LSSWNFIKARAYWQLTKHATRQTQNQRGSFFVHRSISALGCRSVIGLRTTARRDDSASGGIEIARRSERADFTGITSSPRPAGGHTCSAPICGSAVGDSNFNSASASETAGDFGFAG
jgi:hypothetical protein